MPRKRSPESAAEPSSSAQAHEEQPSHAAPDEPGPPAGKRPARARNGASARAPAEANGAADSPDRDGDFGDRVERAEQMVDQIAERVGHYTSVVGRQLLRMGMRAREEAEDMWAEARSIRNGRKRQ
jgi:hypothetical protein